MATPCNVSTTDYDGTTVDGQCSTNYEQGSLAVSTCTVTTRPDDSNAVDITVPPSGIDPLNLQDVTTETVDGTGVFDVYMRAGMNQLNTQYDMGRIKGADFAGAYVAQIQLMMTEANKFVIESKQLDMAAKLFELQYLELKYKAATQKAAAEKMIYEKDLIYQQIDKTIAEKDATCQQTAELKSNGLEERKLKSIQAKKVQEDKSLVCQQLVELKENGAQERALKLVQTKKTEVEKDMVCTQTTELSLNGVIERELKIAQTNKTIAEEAMVDQQTLLTIEQTDKTKKETILVSTQTSELLMNGVVERNLKIAQTGVQNEQALLYERQVTGYDEKNKNENAKMLLDAWAVQAVEEPDPTQYKITSIADTKLEIFADEVKTAGGFGI